MALAGEVTNRDAIEAYDVTFPSGSPMLPGDGHQLRGYMARPKGAGSYPGVIILHEAFGLVEHERDVARRFANAGFVALAPDVYTRIGAPRNPSDMTEVRAKMFGLKDDDLVRDFEAAAAFVRAESQCNGKVGCVGFCVGGRWTLLFACSSDKVDAAIPCWGGFITRATPEAETTPERPRPVISLAPQVHCPLYIVGGEEDQNPSPADLAELRKQADKSGKPVQMDIFKGAGHAFFADYRPSYREQAAFELWPRMISFFKTHLR